MTAIRLHAPMAGWAAPLDEVPDPVFAERMMGDGLAIDPLEGIVRAPCDGEIAALPDTAHAVTLRLANGAEILIHIGLETVGLGGAGFTPQVAPGQRVKQGDALIEFDLDAVALRAKSLITPIILVSEGYALSLLATGRAAKAGDPIAEVAGTAVPPHLSSPAFAGEGDQPKAGGGATRPNDQLPEQALTRAVTVGCALGIHARPAARIVAAAKGFGAALELTAHGRTANPRSLVALMALGLKGGDSVRLSGSGPDAAAAVAALGALIERELDPPGAAAQPSPAAPVPPRATADGRLHGICAAPGFAVGPLARFAVEPIAVDPEGRGVGAERHSLAAARAAVALRIAESRSAVDTGGISSAHVALLEDADLVAAAERALAAGRSAGAAWREAVEASASAFRDTGNPLLIERIDDLRDIEWQVLAELAGEGAVRPRALPNGVVLAADNLLVSQLLALDLGRIAGICCARGGLTSHVAILAASAGVPMLVAAGERVLALEEGRPVILDASAGWVDPAPDSKALAAAHNRQEDERRRRAEQAAAAAEPCRMADGTRIEIFANLASAAEAGQAVEAGAEGCGLLRTEFLFHERPSAPTEAEQEAAYSAVARALGGRPLIVRTLDAGGDKPLAYLALPPEENPALGLRGVRLGLVRPELLAVQLRAIQRAAPNGDIRIMVPMIVDVAELRVVRAALDQAARDVGTAPLPLGVMVETPAAALLAAGLAAEADFLSVGTNDLSQYALAADRGNPATAARLDALHPAVLRLVASVGEGARRHGKWFGVCGGVASDPLAAAILIGLGATELSAVPAAIPALKAAVRRLSVDQCEALAARALEAESAEAVRAMAAEVVAASAADARKGAA